jgi:hypothetical protein
MSYGLRPAAHGGAFVDRMITSAGDIVEDEVVTAAGSYSASASLTSAGPWITQMVAFRSAGSPAPPATPTLATTSTPTAVALAYVQGNSATVALCQTTVVPYLSSRAARRGSQCGDRGMERCDRAGHFSHRLQRQCLTAGRGPSGAYWLARSIAICLLR